MIILKNNISKNSYNNDIFCTRNVKPLLTSYINLPLEKCIIQQNFIVNNYKLHLDEDIRIYIKNTVKEYIEKYRHTKNLKKKLKKDFQYEITPETPKWLQIRIGQITTLIVESIKHLRFSKDLEVDIVKIFGDDDTISMIKSMGFPKNGILGNTLNEWEKDYVEEYILDGDVIATDSITIS